MEKSAAANTASSPEKGQQRERVAVIGAGIGGLASAFLLHEQGKDVVLFEAEDRCGGHALTFDTKEVGPVDLGFQVCNLTTYPHLMGFLRTLGVDTEPSDMSFSLSTPSVEWGSLNGFGGMFAQPGSATSPRFLRMWYEIIRFSKNATEVLDPANAKQWENSTLRDYLKKRGYSQFFAEHYVVPMCAAIWSCSDDDALAWPVMSLVRFWQNHHLLSLLERPVWRVLKGRSRAYVDAVTARLPDVRTGTPVAGVKRLPGGGVELSFFAGKPAEKFDHVVLATHTDITRRILGTHATREEAAALEAIGYQANDVYLHTDDAWMPRNRNAWASWNCIKKEEEGAGASGVPAADGSAKQPSVCVSYWVNLLQNLPKDAPQTFVTLNPPTPPDPKKTLHKLSLAHPLLNMAALAAQKRLSTGDLQGSAGVWFAGAWCGYGFHEDGIRSAVEMAQRLCGKKAAEDVVPWEPIASQPNMTRIQNGFFRLFQNYGAAMLPSNAAIRLVLPSGAEALIGNPSAAKEDLVQVTVTDGSLFSKVVMRSDIGLGEAYMDGSFIPDDIFKMIEVLSRVSCEASAREDTFNALGFVGGLLFRTSEALEMAAHRANTNTVEGSSRNISYHYDAGNDFYKLFLDNTMMYSSGIHKGLYKGIEGLDFQQAEAALEEAQYAKLDAMIKRADLQPGEHVLEIGCGWGACAIRMAQKAGVRVTGITVSNEQLLEARARVAAAGLSDRIDIIYCDYRLVDKRPDHRPFDKVVSIEMLEAVGHEHLNSFFDCVHRYLKPGGVAAVQVITLPDDRYKAYCETHSDFIRTYIFPGGHLPSLGAMTAISSRVGLELTGCDDVGPDYAVTLRLWRDRMMARQETIRKLGYPQRFIRMYEFYFAYCEAGFANGLIHDYQISWKKSHLAAISRAPRSAAAPNGRAAAEATAERADGAATDDAADSGHGAALDPVTGGLLLVWLALVVTLVLSKRHMALTGATCAAFVTLRTVLQVKLPGFGGMSFARASTFTALVAAVALTLGSLVVLARAVPFAPAHLSPASALAHMILSPATPGPLLEVARVVVGTAAGFAALRAWECVRDTRQRSLWEAAAYTVSLCCTSAALFYDAHLIGLIPTQLCEAHSLLLRVRSLRALSGAPPSSALWSATWLAYAGLRVLPHAILLAVYAHDSLTNSAPPTRLSATALLGLACINVNNLAVGWGMLRAQTGEARTAALAQTQHRAQGADGVASTTDFSSAVTPAQQQQQPSAPSAPPVCLPWALTALCAAGLLTLTTLQQEPACQAIVASASLGFAALYMLLGLTGLFAPASGLTPAERSEWRSRLLSTLNACILVVGALKCFGEWPYSPPQEGWISQHKWSNPVTYASIFVGYLQWDVCWCLYHQRSNPDVAAIVHHTLFAAITHYVLYGWYFKVPYAWLSFAELSTPFLNGRWFLAVTGRKAGALYVGVSLLFALTFLATRVVGYGLGLHNLWQNYHLWKSANTGLYWVIGGVHAGFALNLFWSKSVIAALVRSASGGKEKAA